ncbi:MAG: ABC transporter ATP-binding protein [Thiobacillaceae bacterium]
MTGLRLKDLKVVVDSHDGPLLPVDGVSLEVGPRQCVTLLGESGCGKSLTALALMRLLPEGLRIGSGEAWLGDTNLFALPEKSMRAIRGGRLAMIFQEPLVSLNPVMTVGAQIIEALHAHGVKQAGSASARIGPLLAAVGLEPSLAASYPFQLSGGQRQRALIATMLAGEPELLIADEPTTALDVTVQAQILRLLKRLQHERGMGLLLITHDLDVARDMADRVAVMYAGQMVEWADRERLFEQARHPYTRTLFRVIPSAKRRGEVLEHLAGSVPPLGTRHAGCRFADRCPRVHARCRTEPPALQDVGAGHWVRCHLGLEPEPAAMMRSAGPGRCEARVGKGAPLLEVEDLAVHFPIRRGLFKRTVGWVKAVDGVSLRLAQGETLALVGESGCGKSTLAKAILRLVEPSRGWVRLDGHDITALGGEALRRRRAQMQIVFQDPYSSLNPRMRVGEILEEGLLSLRPELDRSQRQSRVAELLERVGLEAGAARRYPHAFSGGQRQRIAIARALAVGPRLLICDEPTSALDVSVQAQIINMLRALQHQEGLAYLFITHNLPVVGYLAHRIMVMYKGLILEEGPAGALFERPQHPYTRLLLDSAPGQGLRAEALTSDNGRAGETGCPYAHRCPVAEARCRTERPILRMVGGDRRVACHLVGGN